MKLYSSLLIAILVCIIPFNYVYSQQSKRTVAVLNFVNAGGVDNNEISILTDRFNSALFNTNVYKILEREKMDALLKEQDFKMSDNCNSTECAVQVGQLLGVEIMVAGKIGKIGQTYTIDARMIDVATGELLKTSSENYKGEKDGLLGLIVSMANTIANKVDISAESLEQELAKLQEQNKKLEEEKNLKAQKDNLKKQEELKAQLASLEQNKTSEKNLQLKTDAEKLKAQEEQKRKQELFTKIEKEKKKQSQAGSEGLTYLQAIQRITELNESIGAVEQEIEAQKQKAITMAVNESPRGEFETQQEYNSRLENNRLKQKQVSDEYDALKIQSRKVYTDELTTIRARKHSIGKERLSLKLGIYNVDGVHFPVTVTEIAEEIPCDSNLIPNYTNLKILVDRENAKRLRENESLLDIKATMFVSAENRLIIDHITIVDPVNQQHYEFATNMNLRELENVSKSGLFVDPRDEKTYATIKVGTQTWMAQNLDFDAGEGSYCYGGSAANCSKHGRLYTWETAKRAAPAGWHLPSTSEFEELLNYLGGPGNKSYLELIECGNSRLNVLFGGWYANSTFTSLGSFAGFWSSSEYNKDNARRLSVSKGTREASLDYFIKNFAFSVRCIKD